VIWVTGVALVVALLWLGSRARHRNRAANSPAIADLGVTRPLNQPGGDTAPDEAYEVYSALYETPAGEPLVFGADSMVEIPQVNGSCLRPKTAREHEMVDAFEAANKQSHRWENKFAIATGYRILPRDEALHAQYCIVDRRQAVDRGQAVDAGQGRVKGCGDYKQLRHVRYLGVPGFDHAHTRALVSVVKECGGDCGSGGIFEVEKMNGHWQRAAAGDLTRECSWMY
jgi:hypothetical protein